MTFVDTRHWPVRATATRTARVTLDAFVAVAAIAGAIGLLADVMGMSVDRLDGTPFDSYVIPALVLGIVVGGSSLVALALELRRDAHARRATLLAGVLLAGWIIVQVALIGSVSWLQPFMFAVGTAQVAAAWISAR